MVSMVNSVKHLIKIISVLHTLFWKIKQKEKSHPNKFYEASINLVAKPDKHITRKSKIKLQINIFHEHRCKKMKFSKS